MSVTVGMYIMHLLNVSKLLFKDTTCYNQAEISYLRSNLRDNKKPRVIVLQATG